MRRAISNRSERITGTNQNGTTRRVIVTFDCGHTRNYRRSKVPARRGDCLECWANKRALEVINHLQLRGVTSGALYENMCRHLKEGGLLPEWAEEKR